MEWKFRGIGKCEGIKREEGRGRTRRTVRPVLGDLNLGSTPKSKCRCTKRYYHRGALKDLDTFTAHVMASAAGESDPESCGGVPWISVRGPHVAESLPHIDSASPGSTTDMITHYLLIISRRRNRPLNRSCLPGRPISGAHWFTPHASTDNSEWLQKETIT